MELWTEDKVDRVLEWYEKDPGDAFVGEESLKGISLDELRLLIRPDEDDPDMVLPYEVEDRDVPRLQQAVEHVIELERYDYFVAAYRKETHRR